MFVKLVTFACFLGISLAAWHGPLAGGAPADKYPAGVSPQACPNYPHCDNPAVAANPSAPSHGGWNGGWNGAGAGAGAWNGAGAGGGWNGGGHNGGGWNGAGAGGWNGAGAGGGWNGGQNALDNGEYTGDGDYRGEGLAESGAYGDISHNYNSENSGAWNGAGAGGWNGGAAAGGWNGAHAGHAAQVPAGVDPGACPNYPFCH